MRVNIRWAEASDLTSLFILDQEAFGSKACTLEWLEAVLAGKFAACLLVEINRQLAGYLLYDLHFQDNEVVLLRLATNPRYQRQGVASTLLKRTMTKIHRLSDISVRTVAEESNLPMQLLLKKFGFRCTKVTRYRNRQDLYHFLLSPRNQADGSQPHQEARSCEGR